MELRVLQYFLTVVQEGNITKAADVLHITQPTLSRQLTELESELGTLLFIRGKRTITMTEDGLLFQQRAREIMELAEKSKREFTERSTNLGGYIAVGCTELMATYDLMNLICDFHQKYPNVRFDLFNGYTEDVKEKIDKGLLDIGLLLEPVEISKYNFMRLNRKEIWGVLVRKDDPLAGKDFIKISDIVNLPLIIPKRMVIHNEILNWFGYGTNQLKIVATYSLLSNAVILIEKGMGCALAVKGSVMPESDKGLKFLPIKPERSMEGILIWKKDRVFNPAATLFIQMLTMLLRHDE